MMNTISLVSSVDIVTFFYPYLILDTHNCFVCFIFH